VPHVELFSLVVQSPQMPPVGIAVVIALLVISLGIHEAAHGWVALRFGDTTARDLGRITLNPIPHIDPFLTILLPLLMWFSTGGRMIFGGARPVPVTYHNLRSPLRHMAFVALAGPGSNFLLAALFFLIGKVLVDELGIWDRGTVGQEVLLKAVEFNLLLSAFNLLPIPPLDGSRVMTWLLPSGLRDSYANLERVGIYLVILLVWFVPPVQALLWTTMDFMYRAIAWIVTLGGAW
jgi:Zn-dependent protease